MNYKSMTTFVIYVIATKCLAHFLTRTVIREWPDNQTAPQMEF